MIVRLYAESPIHHGAFSDAPKSNVTAFRRVPIALPNGLHVPVPHVSGAALRGSIRRLVMRELLDTAGIHAGSAIAGGIDATTYQRLYAALANGGHLEGAEANVDPAARAALRLALPPLSAFGAALYTYLLPGRWEAGMLWPVCRETVEAGVVLSTDPPPAACAEDLVTTYSHTRHVDRDAHDPDLSGVTPMPTQFEVLVPGTVLESRCVVQRCTEIEASCVAHGISLLSTIGGKTSSGLGRVRVDVLDGPTPDAYRDWLAGETAAIGESLRSLAAAMGDKPGKKGKR